MTIQIPDTHRDLLEKPLPVSLATLNPNGQPQLSVVWCNLDGEHILINTARGRLKEKNMAARPIVAILAYDQNDPYRYVEIRGKVVEMTESGAVDHIDQLANLYTGHEKYYGGFQDPARAAKETRVICRIEPTKIVTYGH